MATWIDLLDKIAAVMSGLGYRVGEKPFDGAAMSGMEGRFWLENTSGAAGHEFAGRYDDAENIGIIIGEKKDAGDLTGTFKNLGTRRDTIRKTLTGSAFKNGLPTLIKQVKYIGHMDENAERYIKSTINFEFQIRRTL